MSERQEARGQHTSRPWRVVGERPTLIRTERGLGVADTYGNTIPPHEQEANARLIAAAPDFFDQASALVAPFADIEDDLLREIVEDRPGNVTIVTGRGLTAHFAAAILDARAAIAKAKGLAQ